MQKIRIGFIGAGGIANRHLGNLLEFEDVTVEAIADPVLDHAREQSARCGAKIHADYRQMLDREDLDALYICVPPGMHGPLELTAIERGLPFFAEKPLAADLATAEHVAREVERSGLVTAIGYHWRYLDTTEEAQVLLADNPARLALGYWLDSTPPPAWWTQEKLSGGQIVEQTTHILDLARLLLGEATEVTALGSNLQRAQWPDADLQDTTIATVRFQSGAIGSFSSTCLLGWPHRIGLHLFAEGLAIELSEWEIMIDRGAGRPTRRAEGDAFMREDRAFIDAVKGETNRIRAPYPEAMKTHRLACAAAAAARSNDVINLAEQVVQRA